MNIQQDKILLNLTGVGAMCFKVFYVTRWLKNIRFCGQFNSSQEARVYVDYLRKNLRNGERIAFRIEG